MLQVTDMAGWFDRMLFPTLLHKVHVQANLFPISLLIFECYMDAIDRVFCVDGMCAVL